MTEEKIKKGPSQGGTHPAYYPEYKNMDDVWKRIEITEHTPGVQMWPCSHNPGEIVGLMSYDAAMALAYSFRAARIMGWLETRIIKYQLTYSIETTEEGYHYIDKFDPGVIPEEIEDKS